MTLTSKGQVTIPLEVRGPLGSCPALPLSSTSSGTASGFGRPTGSAGRDAGRADARGRAPFAGPRLTTDEILTLTRGE